MSFRCTHMTNIDLSPIIDIVHDQGRSASCMASCYSLAIYLVMIKHGVPPFMPSILYIYYNTRSHMGTVDQDTGSEFSALGWALENHGVCPETMWPFDPSKILCRPPSECFTFGHTFTPFRFHLEDVSVSVCDDHDEYTDRVITLIQRRLLDGQMVMISMRRHPFQFIDDQGYLVHDPRHETTHYHCVGIIGLDLENMTVRCLNSYGLLGGRDGMFLLRMWDMFEHDILIFQEAYCVIGQQTALCLSEPVVTCLEFQARQDGVVSLHSPSFQKYKHTRPLFGHFRHVIVGCGLTGVYLAMRLRQLFPQDSLLLLDCHDEHDNERFSSVHSVTTPYPMRCQSSVYRIERITQPRSFMLCCRRDQHQQPFVTQNEPPTEISQRVLNGLARLIIEMMGVDIGVTSEDELWENIMTLEWRVEMMKDSRLCRLSATECVADHIGLTCEEFEFLCTHHFKIHPDFFCDMNLYTFVVMSGLHLLSFPEWYSPPDFADIYSSMLHGMKHMSFGEYMTEKTIDDDTQHLFLTRVSMSGSPRLSHDGCVSLDLVSSSCGHQLSSPVQMTCDHVYMCSSHVATTVPHGSVGVCPKKRCTLYLFFDECPTVTEREWFDQEFGKMILLCEQSMMMCVMTDPVIHDELLDSRPSWIRNSVIYKYSPDVWPVLSQKLGRFSFSHRIQGFTCFFYPESLFTVSCASHKSLWETMCHHLGVGKHIHVLNSNLSPFFYCMEGSLELVDLFLTVNTHT